MFGVEFEEVHLLGQYRIRLNKRSKERIMHDIFKGDIIIGDVVESEKGEVVVRELERVDLSDIQEIYEAVVKTNQPVTSQFKEIKEHYGLLGILFSIYRDIKLVQVENSKNVESTYLGKINAGMALERASSSLAVRESNTSSVAITIPVDTSGMMFKEYRDGIITELYKQYPNVVALFLYDSVPLIETVDGYMSFSKEGIKEAYILNH